VAVTGVMHALLDIPFAKSLADINDGYHHEKNKHITFSDTH